MDDAKNPLLDPWPSALGVPPFDAIRSEHYLPAFREAMRRHAAEVEAIATSTAAPTFENTVEALERAGADLDRVARVFGAVEAAHTDDTLRATYRTIAPERARHHDAILMNPALFARVESVYAARASLALDDESLRLTEETHKRFVRGGAALRGADRERLASINAELASLSQRFGDNLLEETNDFVLHVTDEADLGDLPSSLKATAAAEARRRGFDGGWAITLQRPSCDPFLECSPRRDLRRRVFEAYAARGSRGNARDNTALAARMAQRRAERAALLGYASHADYVLADSMALTVDAVRELLDRVGPPARRQAQAECDALTAHMHADGIEDELRGWDWAYYAARLRREHFDLDEDATRPYFEFQSVRDGCFAVARRLFGVTLRRLDDVPVWHPEQEAFAVSDAAGAHVGVLYLDYFARPTKSAGAWMNELVEQSTDARGARVAPVVTNNFNYPAPTTEGPSLLSFTESVTLFHEFGHALHGLFSDVRYGSLSGTNVPRDFVEFPSQVFENWFSEPEVLRLFARHVDTGERIPDALVEKIRAAAKFNRGFGTVEYLAACALDLAWHTRRADEEPVEDPLAFEADAMRAFGLPEAILPRYRTPYFAHVFAGGYAAGYYSYLWSEILDADAFAAFREAGLFDQDLAASLRALLARGGSAPGMQLYVDFRGREPEIDALLERRGLVDDGAAA